MNYFLIYNKIVLKAQNEKRTKNTSIYFESHHIIPRSMGGSNRKDNLVLLSAKEHFVAHHLLWKIHKNSGMALAFLMMVNVNKTKITAKTYETVKTEAVNKMLLSAVPNGNLVHKLKLGFHALSKEEIRANASKSGISSVNNKSGVHGLSKEEATANSSKAGKITAAKGLFGACTVPREQLLESSKRGGITAAAKMSKETRLAASKAGSSVLAAKQKGCKWITDGNSRKRLFVGEVLPVGWKFGFS